MYVWFIAGMLLRKYYHRICILPGFKRVGIYIGILTLSLGAQVGLILLRSGNSNYIIGLAYKFLLCVVGISAVWSISSLISVIKKDTAIKRWLKYYGVESMGFYVLSYFVQTPGVTFYSKAGGMGIPYWIWVVALFVGAVLFSSLANKIVKKSRVLSFVVLGV